MPVGNMFCMPELNGNNSNNPERVQTCQVWLFCQELFAAIFSKEEINGSSSIH